METGTTTEVSTCTAAQEASSPTRLRHSLQSRVYLSERGGPSAPGIRSRSAGTRLISNASQTERGGEGRGGEGRGGTRDESLLRAVGC